ncbi:MAG: hypothetical protein WCJ64_00435 [Rhodospirillaceae bacterium]
MDFDRIDREDQPDLFEAEAAAYTGRRQLDYRYLRSFRDYQAAYSGTIERDASFLLQKRGQTVGLVYAPVERRGVALSMTIGGGYIPGPAVDDDEAERAAFARLEEIARTCGAEKIALHTSLTDPPWHWNRFRAYGFVDTSALDAVIDLRLDEAALRRSLRKSYKALVNKYSDNNGYSIVIVDANNPSYELHEHYRWLHAKCAGRVTRAKESFDLQYRMLEDGHATLMLFRSEAGIIGSAYFLHHGPGVDYLSMADDPDFAGQRLPVSHVLVWAAVRYFKAAGFHRLRLSAPAGFSLCEGYGAYAEPKELGIAHFKHGMATGLTTYFRGIRYYGAAAMRRDLETFGAALSRSLDDRNNEHA